MFTILNDLQLGINELCILYEKIEKLEKQTSKERKGKYENLEISSRNFINYF